MNGKAFHGNAALKAEVLDRLRRRWDAGAMVPQWGLLHDPQAGRFSVMGACLDGDDEAEFEACLGVPVALARLHEVLLMQGGYPLGDEEEAFIPAPEARGWAVRWVEAITPGADLSDTVPRFVAALIRDLLDGANTPLSATERTTLGAGLEVALMCERHLAGVPTPDDVWQAVRVRACGGTDCVTSPAARAAAGLIEVAAWPPHGPHDELAGAAHELWMGLYEHFRRSHMRPDELAQEQAMDAQLEALSEAESQPGFDRDAYVAAHPSLRALFNADISPQARERAMELDRLCLADKLPLLTRQFEELVAITRAAPVTV